VPPFSLVFGGDNKKKPVAASEFNAPLTLVRDDGVIYPTGW
jgi:hypothetical protein